MCFSLTYYFVNISLYLYPIGLYYIKRHVWRVKMFHKTIHKAWNLFKLSKQSPENSTEKSWFSISRVLFSIGRTGIKQRSRHPETPRFFLYHFNWSSQSFDQSKMLNSEFSLGKFQNLNFHFMKQYYLKSNNIITTYLCIYLYIQQW